MRGPTSQISETMLLRVQGEASEQSLLQAGTKRNHSKEIISGRKISQQSDSNLANRTSNINMNRYKTCDHDATIS